MVDHGRRGSGERFIKSLTQKPAGECSCGITMAILDYEAFGLAVKDVGYFFVFENVTGDACDLS